MGWSNDQDAIPLREARHRTANLFQLLASLGRLRAQRASDGEARRKVVWLQEAIAALGVLQRRQLSPDGDDFAAFLDDMTPHWRRRAAAARASLEVAAEPAILSEQTAAALALIVQELVANALAHGFPHGRTGVVRIELRRLNPDRAVLSVTDDGVGYAEAAADPGCLGLWLVGGLADQVRGVLTTTREGGVCVRLEFPLA